MKIIEGDVFAGEYQFLLNQANIYCTWVAGFVIPLKKLYPEAYQADLATQKGDTLKLGRYSSAVVKNGKLTVVNLYAQTGIGNDGNPLNRNLQYDFLFDCLYRLCEEITETRFEENIVIGCPEIGCGLAAGKRRIVYAILEEIENMFPRIEFNVYKLPLKK